MFYLRHRQAALTTPDRYWRAQYTGSWKAP